MPKEPIPLVHPGRFLQQNLRRPGVRHGAVPETATEHARVCGRREADRRLRLQGRVRLLAGHGQVLRVVHCGAVHDTRRRSRVRHRGQVSGLPDEPMRRRGLRHVD